MKRSLGRSVRLNIRLHPDQRALLKLAAYDIDATLTDFVLSAALDRARELKMRRAGISFKDEMKGHLDA